MSHRRWAKLKNPAEHPAVSHDGLPCILPHLPFKGIFFTEKIRELTSSSAFSGIWSSFPTSLLRKSVLCGLST